MPISNAEKFKLGHYQESGAMVEAGELPVVAADRPQLTQVFQNLISNAIKFRSAAPPAISIGAGRRQHHWQFTVRDNGIGIAAEHADSVFGIFHRLHTRVEYPGNGIGLAICKRIVERFGEKIWLEACPGQGTAFQFNLPAAESCEKGGAR